MVKKQLAWRNFTGFLPRYGHFSHEAETIGGTENSCGTLSLFAETNERVGKRKCESNNLTILTNVHNLRQWQKLVAEITSTKPSISTKRL